MDKGPLRLSESEYRVIERAADKGFRRGSISEASKILGIEEQALHSIFRLLESKGLARVIVEEESRIQLTSRGEEALTKGLPEERLVGLLRGRREASIDYVRRELGREAGIAIGLLRREGLVVVERGIVRLVDEDRALERVSRTRLSLEKARRGEAIEAEEASTLKSRGLVREEKIRRYLVEFTVDPHDIKSRAVVEVGKLNSSLLREGRWRNIVLRRYDVKAEPPRVLPARTHFLAEFIELLRDIMRELGFKEVQGPLVELELFNFDVLFQAQDHPAREIHDTLRVKEGLAGDLGKYGDLAERVSRIHERGWRYKWDPRVASRLILRSQTTAVTARFLHTRPDPPVRAFTIDRVFRYDPVGPTRLPEFHQLDGIEGDYDYSFRDLLGILSNIAERLGLQVKFKPAYFPFTEPSVEGYVRFPGGRWVELFGAGIFRPEVTEALGVDYTVGAWGMGVERLALAFYGLSDIRVLYTQDIDFIRSFRVVV